MKYIKLKSRLVDIKHYVKAHSINKSDDVNHNKYKLVFKYLDRKEEIIYCDSADERDMLFDVISAYTVARPIVKFNELVTKPLNLKIEKCIGIDIESLNILLKNNGVK